MSDLNRKTIRGIKIEKVRGQRCLVNPLKSELLRIASTLDSGEFECPNEAERLRRIIARLEDWQNSEVRP